MKFSKDSIIAKLKELGRHDDAEAAASELPDEIDDDNAEHKGILDKLKLGEVKDKVLGVDLDGDGDRDTGIGGAFGRIKEKVSDVLDRDKGKS